MKFVFRKIEIQLPYTNMCDSRVHEILCNIVSRVYKPSTVQVLFLMYQILAELGILDSMETSKVVWNVNPSIFFNIC